MEKEYNFSVGEIFQAIRKIKKLTQVDLSRSLGVVQSTISKIESDVFEDVPFQVVSNVSKTYKIPIHYFQIGHLPIAKKYLSKKVIPEKYVADGVFDAKAVFIILSTLAEKDKEIYKKIKIPYVLLSLSRVKYNYRFIEEVYSIAKNSFIDITDRYYRDSARMNKVEEIKHYIQEMNKITLIDVQQLSQSKNNNLSLTVFFDSPTRELNPIYAKFLELELKVLFGGMFKVNTVEIDDYIEKSLQDSKKSSLKKKLIDCHF
ncbi:MAG: helix-turn-helix transcriptional regulator [Bacteriovoracaceae bacterium]|nr:helix-turn-helix transcriptional regulator [Bacteriovoracaceae bacterium]